MSSLPTSPDEGDGGKIQLLSYNTSSTTSYTRNGDVGKSVVPASDDVIVASVTSGMKGKKKIVYFMNKNTRGNQTNFAHPPK